MWKEVPGRAANVRMVRYRWCFAPCVYPTSGRTALYFMTLTTLAPPPGLPRNPSFSGHEMFASRYACTR